LEFFNFFERPTYGDLTRSDPTTSKPKLQFSKQHSLTMGHCTPLDSKSKLNTSDASNIFILSPSVVFNRFVEEQEPSPYDTGSDSEADEKKD
jgi:hypothetical protein